MKFLVKFIGVIFLVIIVWAVYNTPSKNPIKPSPKKIETKSKPKPAQINSAWKTTKGGDFAAATEEIYDRVIKLVAAGDREAVNELMEMGVVIILKKGLKVQIMDSRWTGKIKIRLKGTQTEVWTAIEAVE